MARRTKIVCTLGPAVDDEALVRELLIAGMDVARFNFSHGSHDEHRARMDRLKRVRAELDAPCAIMLDTRGPEIRTGTLAGGRPVQLRAGEALVLTERAVEGTPQLVGHTCAGLACAVAPGASILLDDGLVELVVDRLEGADIRCTVRNDGLLGERKSINVPGVNVPLPVMTEQDEADLAFGIEQDIDFVAASFVRNAEGVRVLRRFLDEHGGADVGLIAKIECAEAVENFEAIIEAADGVMVARGDLGVEVEAYKVPHIQKEIIRASNRASKPVITATQMLDSMMRNPRPTRAEVGDVANAIYDGTGAVMLSGETAAGKYPVEALKAMATIAETTEADSSFDSLVHHSGTDNSRLNISAAVGHAACTTATDIGASAIITASKSGETARLLSRFRPDTQIIACVLDETTRCQLNVYRGVTPLLMDYATSTDELISMSVAKAKSAGLVQDGDLVVVTAGVPVGISGTTNMIKVHMVGDSLLAGVGIGSHNAKGEVCVCRNAAEAAKKFKPGQILVVPFTTNDMLPFMREAAGIITEEAGTNSHSAIVGLTLDKAVIVGATNATRTLKDGMTISMDCVRGVVQAMAK